MDDSRLATFSDKKARIYTGKEEPELKKEITYPKNAASVFCAKGEFGIVYKNDGVFYEETSDARGKAPFEMYVYDSRGELKFSKELYISYKEVKFLDNGEIAVIGEYDMSIYESDGRERFSYEFDTRIYNVLSLGRLHDYLFVTEDAVQRVRLT